MLVLVQRPDDVVSGRQVFVAVEPAPGERDQVRGVQLRVLAVDRDEELHDLVRRQVVEDDGRHLEVLQVVLLGELVEGEQAVLPVQRAQDPRLLGELQGAGFRSPAGGGEFQAPVGDEQHAAGDRRKAPRIGALEVVGDELLDLLLDDRTLVRLLRGRDPLLEELPVDAAGGLLLLSPGRLAAGPEGKDLEADQCLQVRPREQGLVKTYAELVQP